MAKKPDAFALQTLEVPEGNADFKSAPPRSRKVPQAMERTTFLIDSLGSGAEVARLLGVNRSQPAQWRSGK